MFRTTVFLCLVLVNNTVAQTGLSPSRLAGWQTLVPEQRADSILAVPYDKVVGDLNGSRGMFHQVYQEMSKTDEKRSAQAAAWLATVHYLLGSYDSSTWYNLDAIARFARSGDRTGEGNTLCALGYQMKRRNLSEAFRYYRKGMDILEEQQAQDELVGAYDNFGVLYEMRGDLDSAVFFYTRALRMKEDTRDSIGIPFSLNKIAVAEMLRGNTAAAKPLFERAYGIRLRRDDRYGLLENKAFFGNYYQSIGDWPEAVRWYLASNADCDSLAYPAQKQANLIELSRCYEAMGDPLAALQSEREAASLQHQLLNESTARNILELEKRFELAEKDRMNAELQAQNARQSLYVTAAVSGLILLAALSGWYLQVMRRRAWAARDAAIIAEREAGLRAAFDATEEERKRIAKDLHDGIGQQLGGLRLGWDALRRRIADQLPTESKGMDRLTETLDQAAAEVRVISHQMMPRALQERGLLPALEDMVQRSLSLTGIRFRVEHFQVEGERFQERVEVGIYRVAQELISNIIRHSGATEVVVQLFRNRDYLVLIIEDNGKGFDSDKAGDGIGMLNISSRLHTVSGEVRWEPGPGSGTVATIRIPLHMA